MLNASNSVEKLGNLFNNQLLPEHCQTFEVLKKMETKVVPSSDKESLANTISELEEEK